MKRFTAALFAFIFVLSLFSCDVSTDTSEEVSLTGSAECTLENFVLNKKSNPWLMSAISFTVDEKALTVTAKREHPCIYSEPLCPSFKTTGTKVLFDGVELESSKTAVMLKADSVVTVVAENGTTREYSVITEDSSRGLPVVLISTANSQPIISIQQYIGAVISVVGGKTSAYAEKATIRVRGNSTAGYEKKPYRIKFDSGVEVLGMGKFTDWVLLADFFDRSLLRTQIAHNFASKLEGLDYTPDTDFCEVYLNGEYVGVYNIGHHIEADNDKVDIDLGSPEADTGYILQCDARADEEGFVLGKDLFMLGGAYMCIDYPKTVNAQQFKYISEYVERVNRLLSAKSEYAWRYIDIDSFIDWYIVNELTRNTDAAMFLSTRLHKNTGEKLKMGPVWDFDLSCGNADYGNMENPEGWYIRNAILFSQMFEYPEFCAALRDRWNELTETAIPEIFEEIDYYEGFLSEAYDANFERWQIFGTYVWPTPAVIVDYTEQTQHDDYLRDYLHKRIEWLDREINALKCE